jgi:CTP-dependent riboflavin kinase
MREPFSLKGVIVSGCGDFSKRMNRFPDVFRRAMGYSPYPGTLNVDVGSPIAIEEEFRIRGTEIDEPGQDLLFEPCLVNEIQGFRIRPFIVATGGGGHGDNVLEIACAQEIPNACIGGVVQITLFRSAVPEKVLSV